MVETDRREVQIYQLRAVLSTSEVYVQYFSNFCPLAHTRATAGGFLCRDSTVLRCRDGVFSRKPQCMMALIPEHIPRFWTSSLVSDTFHSKFNWLGSCGIFGSSAMSENS